MPKTKKPDEFKREAGKRLAIAESALGLKARAICETINCAQNTWSQWKSGKSTPDLFYMVRFCDKYGITLDWIYRGIPWGLPANIAQRIDQLAVKSVSQRHETPEKSEERPTLVSKN